jgi:DNA primase
MHCTAACLPACSIRRYVCRRIYRKGERGAPVSAPCTWKEIERGQVNPNTFTVDNMVDRIEKVGDLWGDMRARGRSLKRPMEKLRRLIQR